MTDCGDVHQLGMTAEEVGGWLREHGHELGITADDAAADMAHMAEAIRLEARLPISPSRSCPRARPATHLPPRAHPGSTA